MGSCFVSETERYARSYAERKISTEEQEALEKGIAMLSNPTAGKTARDTMPGLKVSGKSESNSTGSVDLVEGTEIPSEIYFYRFLPSILSSSSSSELLA